jgi:hypothetical protein
MTPVVYIRFQRSSCLLSQGTQQRRNEVESCKESACIETCVLRNTLKQRATILKVMVKKGKCLFCYNRREMLSSFFFYFVH